MQAYEILEAGQALIDSEETWLQGQFNYGDVQFCSIGALNQVGLRLRRSHGEYVLPPQIHYEWLRAQSYLEKEMPRGIPAYNDSHSHRKVMKKWDEAVEAARKDAGVGPRATRKKLTILPGQSLQQIAVALGIIKAED